jgi:hypothetical protein
MRAPAIIRSGWWVAAVAVLVAILTASIVLTPQNEGPVVVLEAGDFVMSTATVERELIVRGMPTDGVRTLVRPATISPQEIDRFNEEERGKLLVSSDRVIGISIGGDTRAYPLRLMRWHEVVNDVVGGEHIAVTYSPLCDSVVVFSTGDHGDEVELGVSGLLFNSNPLLYDRRKGPKSSSLWRQLDGQPVAGPDPRHEKPLQLRKAELVTWQRWRARYPNTRVMAQQPDMKKLYKRDPYHSYFGSDVLRFPVAPLPPETGLRLKDRIVVITIDTTTAVFPLVHFGMGRGTSEITVADVPLRVTFDAEIGVAAVEPLADADRLRSVRYSFWFAWFALKRTIPDNIRAGSSGGTIVNSHLTTTRSPGGA